MAGCRQMLAQNAVWPELDASPEVGEMAPQKKGFFRPRNANRHQGLYFGGCGARQVDASWICFASEYCALLPTRRGVHFHAVFMQGEFSKAMHRPETVWMMSIAPWRRGRGNVKVWLVV